MNRILKITIGAAALLLAFVACHNDEYAVVDIPMGTVNLTSKLASYDLAGTPAGQTKIAGDTVFRFSDEKFLNRLKYYKDEKDITYSSGNMAFQFVPQGRTPNDATGVEDLLIIASVDGEETGRFELAYVAKEDFSKNIVEYIAGGDNEKYEEYEQFVKAFFDAVVLDRKAVKLGCTATIIGFKASNPNVNLGDFKFGQDMSFRIKIKR